MDYKNIHIGSHIRSVSVHRGMTLSRASSYFGCGAQSILDVYSSGSIDSALLLRWCKLLDYNFFMFYHSHLQLYSPSSSLARLESVKGESSLEGYSFRKNLYSPDIINWLMIKIDSGELSISEVMSRYKIPKTTIYRWRKKYKSSSKKNES